MVEASALLGGCVKNSWALLSERPETALARDWRKRGRRALEGIVDHVDNLCGLLAALRAICSEM